MMSISDRKFRSEVVIDTEKTKERERETERELLTSGKETLEKCLTTVGSVVER